MLKAYRKPTAVTADRCGGATCLHSEHLGGQPNSPFPAEHGHLMTAEPMPTKQTPAPGLLLSPLCHEKEDGTS